MSGIGTLHGELVEEEWSDEAPPNPAMLLGSDGPPNPPPEDDDDQVPPEPSSSSFRGNDDLSEAPPPAPAEPDDDAPPPAPDELDGGADEAGDGSAKPSEARLKKKKKKRPKDCMECGVGKVCAKIQKKTEVLWLCRTCTIEIQDLYDRFGTIHKGDAAPIQIEEDVTDESAAAAVQNVRVQYDMRVGLPLGEPTADLRFHIDRCFAACGVENGYPWTGFDYEFAYLENASALFTPKLSFRSANYPENQFKNRYANVLPPEQTRVILTTIKGIPDSDYINANHLDGLAPNTKGRYLGIQGPLDETANDFWRMMWEQNSSVVVMVTREIEGERVKCAQYWPEGETPVRQFGNFEVTCTDKALKDDIITRKFLLKNLKTNQERPVTHFQYIEWPDHGVPASGQIFLGLVEVVDQVNAGGAITVHCSAGIGRTGTFCVVHAVLEKYRRDLANGVAVPPIDVVGAVLHFRKQRPGMVQTLDQLIYCYNTILEWIERRSPDTRVCYALTDFEPLEFERIPAEHMYLLDLEKGERLTVLHRRPDGWCKAINEFGEIGYVSVYYLDPFRYARDYPDDAPLPSLENRLPPCERNDVRPRPPEPVGPTPAELAAMQAEEARLAAEARDAAAAAAARAPHPRPRGRRGARQHDRRPRRRGAVQRDAGAARRAPPVVPQHDAARRRHSAGVYHGRAHHRHVEGAEDADERRQPAPGAHVQRQADARRRHLHQPDHGQRRAGPLPHRGHGQQEVPARHGREVEAARRGARHRGARRRPARRRQPGRPAVCHPHLLPPHRADRRAAAGPGRGQEGQEAREEAGARPVAARRL